jgi:hypothetical protein
MLVAQEELDPEVDDVVVDHSLVEEIENFEPRALTPEQSVMGVAQEPGEAEEHTEGQDPEALDGDFLSALGESTSGARLYGPEVHNEIYNTQSKILLEGLAKQNKQDLLEAVLIPSNCKLLDAPKLNSELTALLNAPSRSRDKLLEDRQQELGLAIGGISNILNSLSKKEIDKFNIIKQLTNVSRILCHLHFQYTEIRRKLVNPFLDRNLVESLKENKREEFLYSNLDTSVKSYSAIKRAANTIKTRPQAAKQHLQNAKNFQQPLRRPYLPNPVHQARGSYRGAHRFNSPRLPYRPQQEIKPHMMGQRGRARYP